MTSPASRTDLALTAAASELRAASAAATIDRAGWATPDQLAARLDLTRTVKILHLSMATAVDIAHVIRDTAADHPGLTAPARIIGMRAQGEAEIAIEQGETRYEGIRWTTRGQIRANQLIPLPEPARRGLINLADQSSRQLPRPWQRRRSSIPVAPRGRPNRAGMMSADSTM